MKVWRHLAVWALWACPAALAQSGQIVDRVVANVNGHVLLQSDWEEELAMEGLLDARPLDTFTAAERTAALGRLIDQELLREQVRPAASVPADQIAERLKDIRKLYPSSSTDEGWRDILSRSGLTESTLEKRLGENLELMLLVDARLRPSIQIDHKAVESYYQDQFLPQLRKSGGKEVTLSEVVSHIRDVLAEEKLNQLLSSWLNNLRSEGHIETRESDGGDQLR